MEDVLRAKEPVAEISTYAYEQKMRQFGTASNFRSKSVADELKYREKLQMLKA